MAAAGGESEVVQLRRRLEEERLLAVYLRTVNGEKDETIRRLTEERDRLVSDFDLKLDSESQQWATLEAEKSHRIRLLELENDRLIEECRVLRGYEDQLEKVRAELRASETARQELERRLDDYISERDGEQTRHRYLLEQEFRARVKEAMNDAQEQVWKSMSEESKIAVETARALQEKLDASEKHADHVLVCYNQLKDAHNRIKSELEIEKKIAMEETRKAAVLKGKLAEAERKLQLASGTTTGTLSAQASSSAAAEQAITMLTGELERTRAGLEKVIQEYNSREQEVVRWKRKALEAERRLEHHRKRIEQLTTVRSASPGSEGFEKPVTSALGANEFENLLSIWNSNFAAPQVNQFRAASAASTAATAPAGPGAVTPGPSRASRRAASAPPTQPGGPSGTNPAGASTPADAYERFKSVSESRHWGVPPPAPERAGSAAAAAGAAAGAARALKGDRTASSSSILAHNRSWTSIPVSVPPVPVRGLS